VEVLLVVGAVTGMVVVAPLGYTRWRIRKQIRIQPATRSNAPSWWLVSTVKPAQMHRRLRRAASAARAAASTGDPTLASMAHEAEEHAVALETPLLVAARLGRAGRSEMHAIGKQIDELEAFVARLAVIVRRGRTISFGANSAVGELEARLDALEAAHAELAAIEERVGLQVDRPWARGLPE
jgi:hypothetical protein